MKKSNFLPVICVLLCTLLFLSACGDAASSRSTVPAPTPTVSPEGLPRSASSLSPVPVSAEQPPRAAEDIALLEGSWGRIGLYRDGEVIRTSELETEPIHFLIFDADGTFDSQYVPGGNEIPYGEKGRWMPFDAGLDGFDHTYLLSTQVSYTYELEDGCVKDIIETDAQGTAIAAYSSSIPDLLLYSKTCGSQPLYIYKNADRLQAEPKAAPSPKGSHSAASFAPAGTLGEQEALRTAKAYLDVSAFSREGLIAQLEYEGYTYSEAVYGASNCGADWNEQALKMALLYLRSSSFSESGLIEQLEFDGFTRAEAEYGADTCGADWREQAVRTAAAYLEYMPFSRSDLIAQLEFEGFTHSQAVYGAEQNGY